MEKSIINLVQIFLRKNNISFDKRELSFQIQSHPSYPSLHSITGVLDHFNIENIAADIPVNSQTLLQLPDCFIAQVIVNDNKNLVVVEKKGLKYQLISSSNNKIKSSESDFLEKFTGIIVVVEQLEISPKIKIQPRFWKTVSLITVTFLATLLTYKLSESWYAIVYFLLSVMGAISSITIVKQEMGLKTYLGDAFCSGIDNKKDCDAVLTSKGAEIIKGYKLSDFSILYFTGLTILTFLQISNPVISYSISLLAIPITIYSLYYQYAIIKKWCLLCLSIVSVLWLQALVPILTNTIIKEFIISDFIVFSFIALSITLVWSYLKPLFLEIHQLRKEKIENVKFKRNFTLFENLLQKSSSLNTQLIESKEIIFGNTDALLELLVITSPFCGYCKPVHKQIDQMLDTYKEKVKIKIRFNIKTENKNSDSVKITTRLLELYNEKGSENCLVAMGDIYGDMSPSKWLKKWGDCFEKENYITELDKQSEWCKENAINFTPEILVNGKSFPKEYNRSDLIFFIEELEENCCVKTVKDNY